MAAFIDPEPGADETPVAFDVPGPLAEHLTATGDDHVCAAPAGGRTTRRGAGYSVGVTAPLVVRQAALEQCAPLVAETATPAARRACRAYTDRIAAKRPAAPAPGPRR